MSAGTSSPPIPYQDHSKEIKDAAAQQTAANRPTQNTPFARGGWSQDADGNWTQSVGLTGAMSGMGDALGSQYANAAGSPLDFAKFGPMSTGESARQQAIDSAYGQASSRLDPQWNQRQDALRTQLLNQGLDPGSEAYRNEMDSFSRNRNDAYTSAMNMAIGQGTSAGDSVFRNSMMSRQQAIAEALRQREQPLEEMKALQGLMGMPGFNQDSSTLAGMLGAANSQDANVTARNNYTSGQNAANQAAAADGMKGGASALAALAAMAAMMMSDERVKANIVRHEIEAAPGVPLASWEWKASPGTRHWGVIAQDLERVAPEFVHEIGGIKHVDYSYFRGGK